MKNVKSYTFDSSASSHAVQSHCHMGQHWSVGGFLHYLFLAVAAHPSGSRHVRRGKTKKIYSITKNSVNTIKGFLLFTFSFSLQFKNELLVITVTFLCFMFLHRPKGKKKNALVHIFVICELIVFYTVFTTMSSFWLTLHCCVVVYQHLHLNSILVNW